MAFHQVRPSSLLGFFYMKQLLCVTDVILDQENLTCNCIIFGSHFLFVHVHSTFNRKAGGSAGVEEGGACVNKLRVCTKEIVFHDEGCRKGNAKSLETRKHHVAKQ